MRKKINGVKINQRYGSWTKINEMIYNGKRIYVLENDQYGDETDHILVDDNLNELSIEDNMDLYEMYIWV